MDQPVAGQRALLGAGSLLLLTGLYALWAPAPEEGAISLMAATIPAALMLVQSLAIPLLVVLLAGTVEATHRNERRKLIAALVLAIASLVITAMAMGLHRMPPAH